MEQRRLGRTGLDVGQLGIGTRGLGWHGVDRGEVRRALAHALDRGVTLIDALGPGADELVGEVVRGARARDRAVVVTHVAPAAVTDWLSRAFPPRAVVHAVETALRAGKLDVLPIVALDARYTDWAADEAWPELRATLARLIQEGKVLHWAIGAAAEDPSTAIAEPLLELVLVPHHIFDRATERPVFAASVEHATGLVGVSPLDTGALAGDVGPVPSGDRFHRDDPRAALFPPARLAEAALRAARLTELIEEIPAAAATTDAARAALELALHRRRGTDLEARTLPELALRFALSQTVFATIVGARTIAHVDAAVAAAARGSLSPALLGRLRDLTDQNSES
jgi:aryl-alcohol dehydrogenase-like predicted oxidoreductase